MTIGNGPLGADGRMTSLRYTVENVKRDEICQNEDVVALPTGAQLQSVFFSDTGVRSRLSLLFAATLLIPYRIPVSMTRLECLWYCSTGEHLARPAGCLF